MHHNRVPGTAGTSPAPHRARDHRTPAQPSHVPTMVGSTKVGIEVSYHFVASGECVLGNINSVSVFQTSRYLFERNQGVRSSLGVHRPTTVLCFTRVFLRCWIGQIQSMQFVMYMASRAKPSHRLHHVAQQNNFISVVNNINSCRRCKWRSAQRQGRGRGLQHPLLLFELL